MQKNLSTYKGLWGGHIWNAKNKRTIIFIDRQVVSKKNIYEISFLIFSFEWIVIKFSFNNWNSEVSIWPEW